MNKAERLRQERVTIYKVHKPFKGVDSVYTVRKLVRGSPAGTCDVTLMYGGYVCSCMGFRCQKFPHIEHKHIRIVLDYISRGQPKDIEYRLTGTGRTTKIAFTMEGHNGPDQCIHNSF